MGRFDYVDIRGTQFDPAEFEDKYCRACGELEDYCTCNVHDDFGEPDVMQPPTTDGSTT